jgi:RNA polymerase sigma factor (sigma-70 family)
MVQADSWTPPERPFESDVRRLLASATEGDEQAWAALVDRYVGLLWAIARAHRLSAADAADVVQTTWLRLVENLPRLSVPEAVGAWLATTARRECLRTLRRSGRCEPHAEVPEPPAAADDGQLDERLLTAERDALLWRAFALLPERDQALLRLLVAEPAPSYQEIAAALDMPIGSIGPTRLRALARLRAAVECLDGFGRRC